MKMFTAGRPLSAWAVVVVVLMTGVLADGAGGKTIRCKGGRVPVTVGQRTTCRPLATVLPKPKKADRRLGYLQTALKLDAAPLGGRRPAPAALVRVLKRFRAVWPQALKLIDSHTQTPVARAAAGCSLPPFELVGKLSGIKVGVSEASGGEGGLLEYTTGGLTYRTTYKTCKTGTYLNVPECPTANGTVDASRKGDEIEATTEIRDGETVVFRQSTNFYVRTKAHAKVKNTARLDYIDITDTEEAFIVASGGIVRRGTADRRVRVTMPSGKYDPGKASVKYSGDRLPLDGKNFGQRVASVIEAFRVAESGGSYRPDGWATVDRKSKPYCAEAVFSPASNTLKLKKDATGSVSMYAKARQDGGRATGARWTLSLPNAATFSPMSSTDAAPKITYTVKPLPIGPVEVTVTFTSTAGVGEEKVWTQPIDNGSIRYIGGTFSGQSTQGGSVFDFNGSLEFDRGSSELGGPTGAYRLVGGSEYTVTASGKAFTGENCTQSGSQHFVFTHGSFSVEGTAPDFTPPYTQWFDADQPDETMTIALSGCQSPNEDQNGTTRQVVPPVRIIVKYQDGHQSADGISYDGTATYAGTAFTWHLKGR